MSRPDRLTRLQRDLAREFFARESRFFLTGGAALVGFHLVHERAEQGYPEKLLLEGMRIDPPEEILANKLCTLLSRAEIRDLVDVRALEQASYDLGDALALAARKDTGLTPAQLGWVLSQIEIPDDADLPGGVAATELREYLTDLSSRLARLAWPG